MDSSGKIIWARHNEIQTVNVKSLGADYELVDGERLPLAVKDLGACDLYPQVCARGVVGVLQRWQCIQQG
jgi:coatomer subunit beta'